MRLSSTSTARVSDARRRNRLRHPVTLHAIGRGGSGDGSFEGVLLNLSVGGFLLETGADLAFGESFELDLPGAEGLAARIAWVSTPLYGCEFVQPLDTSWLSPGRLSAEAVQGDESQDPPIGEEIERLRRAKGWTRADLAQKAGVSRPSVWGWETGKTMPRQDALRRLSRALGSRELMIGSSADDAAKSGLAHGYSADLPKGAGPQQLGELPVEQLLSILQASIADRLSLAPTRVKVLFEICDE